MIKIMNNNLVIDLCINERYLKYLPHQQHFIEVKKAGSLELIMAVTLFSIPQQRQLAITNKELIFILLNIPD